MSKIILLAVSFYCKFYCTPGRKYKHVTLIFSLIVIVVQLELISGKICYQCDDKNPSSKFKIIGEKITKCNGVAFDKYATRTSKAFGAAVLTCFTVILPFPFY